MARVMSPRLPMPATPTYIGLDLRLRIEEAEALEIFLGKFRGLIEHRVMTCPGETREPLLTATRKLLDRLAERCPPFDLA